MCRLLFHKEKQRMSLKGEQEVYSRQQALQDGLIAEYDREAAGCGRMKGNCGWCRRVGTYHKLCGYCGESNYLVTVFVTRGRDVVNPVLVANLAREEGEELAVPSRDLIRDEPQYGLAWFDVEQVGTVHYTKSRRMRSTRRWFALHHIREDEWERIGAEEVEWLRQLARQEVSSAV